MPRAMLGAAMMLAFHAAPAQPEEPGFLAVFVDGRVLEVAGARLVDETTVRLDLGAGASVEVPLTRIDRIIEATPVVGEEQIGPAACSPAFEDQSLPEGVPFAGEIVAAGRAADLHPWLVAAVVQAESAFDPTAVSRVGARGLMQLMPSVWMENGVSDPHDPATNLSVGCRHLRLLLDRFGDLRLALAAYNAGAATVERAGGVPPFRETRGFVRNVLDRFCPAPGADGM